MAEKERTSGEIVREQDAPVLPTVNPDAQRSEPSKASIPSAVYVAYVKAMQLAKGRGRVTNSLRYTASGSA